MVFRSGLYDTVFGSAEGLSAAELGQIQTAMLTGCAQQCGMTGIGEICVVISGRNANG